MDRGEKVRKAYWVTVFRVVHDASKLAEYAQLAGPAIVAGGGRFLARGEPSQVYEAGLMQRVALVEFDSLGQAFATHDSPAYQEALVALGNGVERDVRIVEAL